MAITELFSSCQGIASLPLCAGLLIAAALDMRSRRVPNLLTVALLVGGLVARGALGGFGELAWGLGAALGARLKSVDAAHADYTQLLAEGRGDDEISSLIRIKRRLFKAHGE